MYGNVLGIARWFAFGPDIRIGCARILVDFTFQIK
jgi:hypothetical protein